MKPKIPQWLLKREERKLQQAFKQLEKEGLAERTIKDGKEQYRLTKKGTEAYKTGVLDGTVFAPDEIKDKLTGEKHGRTK